MMVTFYKFSNYRIQMLIIFNYIENIIEEQFAYKIKKIMKRNCKH